MMDDQTCITDLPVPTEVDDLRRELNALSLRLAHIVDCYRQFSHLDHLLSDEEWLCDDSDDKGSLTYRRMVFEMWGAIRKAMEDKHDKQQVS